MQVYDGLMDEVHHRSYLVISLFPVHVNIGSQYVLDLSTCLCSLEPFSPILEVHGYRPAERMNVLAIVVDNTGLVPVEDVLKDEFSHPFFPIAFSPVVEVDRSPLDLGDLPPFLPHSLYPSLFASWWESGGIFSSSGISRNKERFDPRGADRADLISFALFIMVSFVFF